jgi:CheY-like chemotaxis protein
MTNVLGSKAPRILVVDDEPDLLGLMVDVLESEGYTVLKTTRPDHALQVITQDSPDLCLFDIMLPGMSGIDLAQSARQAGYSGPIIAMSASRMMTRLASGSDVVTDAIDKPMDISKLLECVKKYVEERQ